MGTQDGNLENRDPTRALRTENGGTRRCNDVGRFSKNKGRFKNPLYIIIIIIIIIIFLYVLTIHIWISV